MKFRPLKISKLIYAMTIFLFACGSKTDIERKITEFDGSVHKDVIEDESFNQPPDVNCPSNVYASPNKPALIEGKASDDGWITQIKWTVEDAPEGSSAAPYPDNSPTTSFKPDIAGSNHSPVIYVLKMTATDNQGLSSSCTTNVKAIQGAPLAICPERTNVISGEAVTLEGSGYDDGIIVSYLWEIVDAPPNSTSRLENSNQKSATFIAGETDTGIFTVQLTVWDDSGLSDTCQTIVQVGGAPSAICPEDMTIPTRTETFLEGNAEDDGIIVSWLWECIENDTDTPPVFGSPASRTTTFKARRVGHYTIRLTVTDDMGLSDSCTFIITTTETGPTAICPPYIETTPLVQIELRGEAEDDGMIVSYGWTLIDKPPGSSANQPSPPFSQVSYFTPDIAGNYTIRLTVTDDSGHTSSCEFMVRAISGEGLRVEMFWNPPESIYDRTDVDLHLLHPLADHWFSLSYDCYYLNCDSTQGFVLEWDLPGPDDNPRLDLDDVDGYGPENININIPVLNHTYTVGIHYYDDESMGPAQVYVKIYCGEISITPVYEAGPVELKAYGSNNEINDFWKVARVTWLGYGCNVEEINTIVSAWEAQTSR